MSHSSLQYLDHRPWPLPDSPWRMRQQWDNLLFAHWPAPKSMLEPLVPAPLKIQEYDGTSWVGVVPFVMNGVTFRPLPAIPVISSFLELNLRLYVEFDGKPGVWFLSLDASNPLAVWVARRFFNLPYFKAEMQIEQQDAAFHYSSKRRDGAKPQLEFETTYRPVSKPYHTEPGTLEHWLTERYCLYAMNDGGDLFRTEIHHAPWTLQKAEADIITNDLTLPYSIKLDGPPPLLHFSSHIEVATWMPKKLT